MTEALSGDQRTALERLVQGARRWIEEDLDETLEGKYGINADGRIEPVDRLTLTNAEEAVRTDLVEIIEYLRSEGEGEPESVARLVREAAFTHTNRLIAVRVAEAVGLLPETMVRAIDSSGFKDFSEIAPTIATTEWGRFAQFVALCADELAPDVPALFDPRNPLLELAMSETVLAQVVGAMAALDAELWAAPDTLGWAYQFFNTGEERSEMRESSAPRNSRELAVRNQFFTPSYVVDFLVQNGLGAHLAAGLPGLADELPLLVEIPTDKIEVDLEAVSVLDPACGSGHFLLGAYDVLELAWQHAGVNPAIAAPAIVRSLWGIDIDPRATQIAQAAVMFRARRHCRDEKLPTANVICARALPAGPEVDELIDSLPEHVGRAVRGIADELVDAPILGPLLKIEERMSREVRDVFGTGVVEGTLAESAGEDADNIEAAVLNALSEVANSTTSSAAQRLFAAEASDAVRFVEAMTRRYSFALANPPFGQGCAETDDYLKSAYGEAWTELYACFVERCMELAELCTGAITSSTFLTIKRLRNYREDLAKSGLSVVVDLGAGVLHGATVNTAALIVSGASKCCYLDIRDSANKDGDLRNRIAARELGDHDLKVFARLPNSPFAFHVSKEVIGLWESGSTLDPAYASVRTGGKTFDNFRYVRAWWELSDDALERGWVWYEKGGNYQPYFAPTPLMLNWKLDGSDLRAYGESSGRLAQVLQSSAFWRQPGVCFPRMSSVGFSARVMPPDEIFADTSIAVLPKLKDQLLGIIGYFNSTSAAELLAVFGRGRSTENESVKHLPIRDSIVQDQEVVAATGRLMSLFGLLESVDETSPAFGGPPAALRRESLMAQGSKVAIEQERLDRRVSQLLGLTERVDTSISPRPELNRSLFKSESANESGLRLLGTLVGVAVGRWELRPDSPEFWSSGEALLDVSPPLPRSSVRSGDLAGVMVDEKGHEMDLVARVGALADTELVDEQRGYVQQASGASLRRFMRSRFFPEHLKRYSRGGRKAPIYWPLQVPSKNWGVWLYAPKLSREVLFAVVQAAEQRQNSAERQIGYLQREAEQGSGDRKASEIAKELEAEQKLAVEVEAFRSEAERIANLGWVPDLDDGIVLNAAPLAYLFPAWKDAAKYRKELQAGKYEWATVAQYADEL